MAAGRAQPGVKGRTRGLHVAHGQSVCGALSVTGALTRGQREVTGELGHLGAAQPLCPRWGGSGGTSGILRDTPRPRLACPRGAGRQGRKGRAAEPRGGPQTQAPRGRGPRRASLLPAARPYLLAALLGNWPLVTELLRGHGALGDSGFSVAAPSLLLGRPAGREESSAPENPPHSPSRLQRRPARRGHCLCLPRGLRTSLLCLSRSLWLGVAPPQARTLRQVTAGWTGVWTRLRARTSRAGRTQLTVRPHGEFTPSHGQVGSPRV